MPLSDLGVLCYDKLMSDMPKIIDIIRKKMTEMNKLCDECQEAYDDSVMPNFTVVDSSINDIKRAINQSINMSPLDRVNNIFIVLNRLLTFINKEHKLKRRIYMDYMTKFLTNINMLKRQYPIQFKNIRGQGMYINIPISIRKLFDPVTEKNFNAYIHLRIGTKLMMDASEYIRKIKDGIDECIRDITASVNDTNSDAIEVIQEMGRRRVNRSRSSSNRIVNRSRSRSRSSSNRRVNRSRSRSRSSSNRRVNRSRSSSNRRVNRSRSRR